MDLKSIKLHYNSIQKIQKNLNNDNNDENIEDYIELRPNRCFSQKIKINDFFSRNEITISKKVMSISDYYNYFNILYKYENIEINEIDEKNIENIKIEDNHFILCYYPKYNLELSLFPFIFNCKTPSALIHGIIESYSHLNRTLLYLEKQDVCFYDISPEKMYFVGNYKPLLSNFERSIHIDNLSVTYLSKIINKKDNYRYKCLEIHILFYILQDENETITYDIANEITHNYIENLKILSVYSTKSLTDIHNSVFAFLEKYIYKPKIFIVEEMIQSIHTWDNYSLGFIYLFILSNIIRVFQLKNTFINHLTGFIIKSIGCIPSKRESLLEITEKTQDLLRNSSTNTFEFINEMNIEKMESFYTNIFS